MWNPNIQKVFRDLKEFQQFLDSNPQYNYTGHNFKFDLKFLKQNNIEIDLSKWVTDSQLLASVCTIKPDDIYLKEYETQRKIENKKLKRGFSHREGSPLSLKVQAPFWLDVEPFWETPESHDNDKYVLKDAQYTYELTCLLSEVVAIEKGDHTVNQLIERSKVVMAAEMRGILLDVSATDELIVKYEKQLLETENQMSSQWSKEIDIYYGLEELSIKDKYKEMCLTAANKRKKDFNEMWPKYEKLQTAALSKIEPFNFNSPTQLTWLLKDQLKYNITNLDGEESTGVEVLETLSNSHEDVKILLKYREAKKALTAFLPEYKNYAKVDGRIHTTFNITGARTGRTSSNSPNMQQVTKEFHKLFVADPDSVLITRDMTSLEPVLIAYFSEDKNLCDIVLNKRNFHSINALVIFPELNCTEKEVKELYPEYRDAAKELGLSVLYGAGANRVYASLLKRGFKKTLEECRKIVYQIRDFYSGVWDFKQQLDFMLESGELIYNYMGRPIRYINKEDIYMKGFNGLIQSSGSDIVMQSMVDIFNKPKLYPILSVHDELVIMTHKDNEKEAEKTIEHEMTKWDLTNSKGQIRLSVEGNNKQYWSK